MGIRGVRRERCLETVVVCEDDVEVVAGLVL